MSIFVRLFTSWECGKYLNFVARYSFKLIYNDPSKIFFLLHVVGGGSAGSVVASRLSELPCVSVLLLEAGRSPPLITEVPSLARFFISTNLSWPYMTTPQKYTGYGLNNNVSGFDFDFKEATQRNFL